ncbi:MAG TPA: hypothetical protein VHA33_29795 [Candidatus Angelobacter sp.]|jgi:hypothetical protein|nr:hypothetical protein [Candidatus Angelobacter sp.]
MLPNETRSLLVTIVLVHFAIVILHGAAHTHLHIELSPIESTYVVAVILMAPLIAAGMLWTSFWRAGASLVGISMVGALIFGGYKHFLSRTNDDVSQMSHAGWGAIFLISSILLFVTEAAGILAGFRAAARRQRV